MPASLSFHLSAEAERAVRAGHPWVYAEALRERHTGPAGALAVLYDHRNRFLAIGLYDPHSPLRVRVLQRFKPAPLDAAWHAQRLREAESRRATLLADAQTTGVRLVHGENDGLPGVIVDRYDRTLVLKLYTAAWLPHLPRLQDALQTVWPAAERAVLRLSRAVQAEAGPELADGAVLFGAPVTGPVAFLERGLRFEADVVRGHKTGFFLDQRGNRAVVEALSRGRTVLDTFAYTGAFAVAAARGGAREILSLESSAPALTPAQRHMQANRRPGARAPAYRVTAGDVFALLRQLAQGRQQFELVVLDPPSFAHTQAQVPAALAAYGRLVQAGLAVLAPEGALVVSSCSGHVGAEAFFTAAHRAARAAGRPLQERQRTGHEPDHPIRFAEGAYLKALVATAPAAVRRRKNLSRQNDFGKITPAARKFPAAALKASRRHPRKGR